MPLEISEIGIRMAVQDNAAGAVAQRSSPAAGGDDGGCSGQASLTPAQMDDIVNRCVQRVLLSLRRMEAR